MVRSSSLVLQLSLLLCVAGGANVTTEVKIQSFRGFHHRVYGELVHIPGSIWDALEIEEINEDPKVMPNTTLVVHFWSDTGSKAGLIDNYYKGKSFNYDAVAGTTTYIVSPILGQLAGKDVQPWFVVDGQDSAFVYNTGMYPTAINLQSGGPTIMLKLVQYCKSQEFNRVGVIADSPDSELAFRSRALTGGLRIGHRELLERRPEVGVSTREDCFDAVKRMKNARISIVVNIMTGSLKSFNDVMDAFEHEGMIGAGYQYIFTKDSLSSLNPRIKADKSRTWSYVQQVDPTNHEPIEADASKWGGSPLPANYFDTIANNMKKFLKFVEDKGGLHNAGRSVFPGLNCSVEHKPWDIRCNSSKGLPGFFFGLSHSFGFGVVMHVFAAIYHDLIYKQGLDLRPGMSPSHVIFKAMEKAMLNLKINSITGGMFEYYRAPDGNVVRDTSVTINMRKDRCVKEEGCFGSKAQGWVEGEVPGDVPIKFMSRNGNIYDVNFFTGIPETTIWFGNTTTRPKDYLMDACGSSHHLNLSSIDKECLRCPTQTINPPGDGKNDCEQFCQPGYAPAADNKSNKSSLKCGLCRAGRTSKKGDKEWEGAKECELCPKGRASIEDRSSCGQCDLGFFANAAGKSSCERCGQGKYANAMGSEECSPCPGHLTTPFPGATTIVVCVCPQGTYRSIGANPDECLPCPSGMTCALGSAQAAFSPAGSQEAASLKSAEVPIAVSRGYYSKVNEPMVIYKCEPEDLCPGGQSGTCHGLRSGFLCSGCREGTIPIDLDDDLTGCKECAVSSGLYLIVVCVLAFLALGVSLYNTTENPLLDSPVKIEMINVVGQVMMFLQVQNAIQSLGVSFGEPFTGFMTGSIAPINVRELMSGLPCLHHGFSSAVTEFSFQLSIPVIFVAALCMVFVIANIIRKSFFLLDGLKNVIGEVLLEFYVAVTIMVLRPLDCYPHPADTGKSSVLTNPEVLCWEGDHIWLVVLAVIGFLLFTVSCLVITFFATWSFPKRMSRNDIGHLIRYHFLFNRWKPECYWFCVVSVTRNCLIAVFPMVIPDKDVAVLLMAVTLVQAALLMAFSTPRRTPAMNALDSLISSTQILILAVGSMSIYTKAIESMAMSWVLLLLTIAVVISCLSILAVKGLQYITTNRFWLSWAFDIFLDHHGGIGASSARMLHMLLTGLVKNEKLFYDLDSYNSLASNSVIVDAAKLSSRGMVVLSDETWCRSWSTAAMCALEEVKARMCAIVILQTDDGEEETGNETPYTSETSWQKQRVPRLAKQAPVHKLRALGICDAQVAKAVDMVYDLHRCPPILLAMNNAFIQQLSAALGKADLTKDLVDKFTSTPTHTKSVLISSDRTHPDGVAASRFLFKSILDLRGTAVNGPLVNHQIMQDVDLDAAAFARLVREGKVCAMIVVITPHTVTDAVQLLRLGFIYECSTIATKSYPLVMDDVFVYPSHEMMDSIGTGAALNLGPQPEETSNHHTTKVVPLTSARKAMSDILERDIIFCNVHGATLKQIKSSLKILINSINDDCGSDPPNRNRTETIISTYWQQEEEEV